MKTPASIILITLATAAALPAAVTISANVLVPNGPDSGGNGTATAAQSDLSISNGSITASTSGGLVTLPVTTYTVTGLNLTSVGGTATESFTFTVGYTATSNGTTAATPTFSAFGNVGVAGDGIVSNAESLTATITLTSTTFAGLSLTGFTSARAGAFAAAPATETANIVWTGGSYIAMRGFTVANGVTGNTFTVTAGSGSTINLEGFGAEFVAVPEPGAASLLALGAAALLRRRRTA
jgi:hypothetical protein